MHRECRGPLRRAGRIDSPRWLIFLAMSVDRRVAVRGLKKAGALLETLSGLGLRYLTLSGTPALSVAAETQAGLGDGRRQDSALFVFDRPTIGLHPDDVQVLLDVLQRLIEQGSDNSRE